MSAVARVAAPSPHEPRRLRTERSHLDVLESNTGWALEPWKWAAASKRREELEHQTQRIADLLEEAGVEARGESDIVAISAVTGIVRPLAPYRSIRFLPSVASRDRRPMLNALRFWMEHEKRDRADFMRYGVVTAGDLVPAFGDLRGALQDLARRVSKWASEASEKYGVTVNFRGSEFTRKTAKARELDARFPPDQVLYHPHANVLFEPTRFLGKERWAEFLSWTSEFFGSHWKDCGRIDDVRELVKYVVKPADLLEGDSPLSADEAAWLHASLFRTNLAQPLGDFRMFWRELAANRRKIVTLRDGDRGRLVTVEKSRRLDHAGGEAEAGEMEEGADLGDEAGEDVEVSEEADKVPEPVRPPPVNNLLGVTLPQWAHTPWAEPMLLVQNYQPRAVGRTAIDRLEDIRLEQAVARDLWDKAGAPNPAMALRIAREWRERGAESNVTPLATSHSTASQEASGGDPQGASYKVHTCSLTVPKGREAEGSSHPPPKRSPRGQVVALQPRSTPSSPSNPSRSGSA